MIKTKSYIRSLERKQWVSGKVIVGIDLAKEKHQVTVLDERGMQMGNSFSINMSHKGFNEDLWKKLVKILGGTSRSGLYCRAGIMFCTGTIDPL